jgi:hypothetical protein
MLKLSGDRYYVSTSNLSIYAMFKVAIIGATLACTAASACADSWIDVTPQAAKDTGRSRSYVDIEHSLYSKGLARFWVRMDFNPPLVTGRDTDNPQSYKQTLERWEYNCTDQTARFTSFIMIHEDGHRSDDRNGQWEDQLPDSLIGFTGAYICKKKGDSSTSKSAQ